MFLSVPFRSFQFLSVPLRSLRFPFCNSSLIHTSLYQLHTFYVLFQNLKLIKRFHFSLFRNRRIQLNVLYNHLQYIELSEWINSMIFMIMFSKGSDWISNVHDGCHGTIGIRPNFYITVNSNNVNKVKQSPVNCLFVLRTKTMGSITLCRT